MMKRSDHLHLDEAAAVGQVLSGQRSAFRPLVERYEPSVFALCCKLLHGERVEAEDLSQETFLRAFRRLHELRDPCRFAPWLYQIARSLCRDRRRKLAVEKRALQECVERQRWESIEDSGGYREVVEALGSIPAEERRALELKYFEGLSYREIADRMQLSFSKVDHLIRGARLRLGQKMSTRLERERSL